MPRGRLPRYIKNLRSIERNGERGSLGTWATRWICAAALLERLVAFARAWRPADLLSLETLSRTRLFILGWVHCGDARVAVDKPSLLGGFDFCQGFGLICGF